MISLCIEGYSTNIGGLCLGGGGVDMCVGGGGVNRVIFGGGDGGDFFSDFFGKFFSIHTKIKRLLRSFF